MRCGVAMAGSFRLKALLEREEDGESGSGPATSRMKESACSPQVAWPRVSPDFWCSRELGSNVSITVNPSARLCAMTAWAGSGLKPHDFPRDSNTP